MKLTYTMYSYRAYCSNKGLSLGFPNLFLLESSDSIVQNAHHYRIKYRLTDVRYALNVQNFAFRSTARAHCSYLE